MNLTKSQIEDLVNELEVALKYARLVRVTIDAATDLPDELRMNFNYACDELFDSLDSIVGEQS